jgi:ATP adenylyltransferase
VSQRPDAFERLWSPWRMEYIARAAAAERRGAKPGGAAGKRAQSAKRRSVTESPCLFCRVAADPDDRANLVLVRRPDALLMLNRYPYNPAHLMVAVMRHEARFAGMSPAEAAAMHELTALAERALEAEYRPHGINAGVNLGRVAGAGFPGHLHLHLVPRWDGDTNFMPVTGATRVLPESLERTWTRLRRALRGLQPAGERKSLRGAPRRGRVRG